MQKSPELPHVPLMLDLATNELWMQALTVLAGNWEACDLWGASWRFEGQDRNSPECIRQDDG